MHSDSEKHEAASSQVLGFKNPGLLVLATKK